MKNLLFDGNVRFPFVFSLNLHSFTASVLLTQSTRTSYPQTIFCDNPISLPSEFQFQREKFYCEFSGFPDALFKLMDADWESRPRWRGLFHVPIWSGFVWFVSLNLLLDFPIDNGNQLRVKLWREDDDSNGNVHLLFASSLSSNCGGGIMVIIKKCFKSLSCKWLLLLIGIKSLVSLLLKPGLAGLVSVWPDDRRSPRLERFISSVPAKSIGFGSRGRACREISRTSSTGWRMV